jgi:hypothetical protein
MKKVAVGFAICIGLAVVSATSDAATWHVPSGPCPTIQSGIDSAIVGDTVIVACGTYHEHDVALKSGICLLSESQETSCVTIDADSLGRVFYAYGVDSTIIRGFTVTGGYAAGPSPSDIGAGMYCENSFLKLMDCQFTANHAVFDGGAGYLKASSLRFVGCEFSGNSGWSGGGLMCVNNSSANIMDCSFVENSGGLGAGGVMCSVSSSLIATNCNFTGNTTPSQGGAAVDIVEDCIGSFINCTFTENVSGDVAGAICCRWRSSSTFTSCVFAGNSAASLGGAIDSHGGGSTVALSNCTLYGNSTNGHGGAISSRYDCDVTLDRSIIAFSTSGEAVYCGSGASATVTCCDVFGNAGGDYVGCISGELGINGNISSDPLFCAPGTHLLTLNSESPCLPGHHPDNADCGLIGALGWGCPGPAALLTSISDVKNDQGRQVSLSWIRSEYDTTGSAQPILSYEVYRRIDPLPLLQSSAAPIGDLRSVGGDPGTPFLYPPGDWHYLFSVPAHGEENYFVVAPTLEDSCAYNDSTLTGEPLYYSVFFVRSATSVPTTYFDSRIDSGYSVDNIPPFEPAGFSGARSYLPDGLTLSWLSNKDADLFYYVVHRGLTEDFIPTEANLIASPRDTTCFDSGWQDDMDYYYKLAAVDINGNRSAYELLAPESITGGTTRDVPSATYLAQNVPNPFNPSTRIAFGIREMTPVTLRIYNVSGQLIKVLVDRKLDAGRYEFDWDGKSQNGASLASGVYLYRLEAGSFKETRKMVLIR